MQVGLVLAMLFRIILLAMVSWLLTFAVDVFMSVDHALLGIHVEAEISVKALVLALGGLVLIWKGVMFSVDVYQNWWEQKFRKKAKAPIQLRRRKK